MNSYSIRIFALLAALASMSLLTFQADARTAPAPSFEGLSSSDFRILPQKSCRFSSTSPKRTADPFGLSKSPWTPTGAQSENYYAQCSPERIEELLLANRTSSKAQANAIENFFSQCERVLSKYAPLNIHALRKLGRNRYDVCSHPGMRKVLIKLPTGINHQALLALKPGNSPRPLVIIKCGALCSTGDASHRFLLMHFFDESPFHVLAIGNGTGSDYVTDNGYFALGGFDEGQQLIHLAKMIQEGPLRARVSSVHSAGVSLGSHAGLFATFFNEHQRNDSGDRYLRSTLAICPVVDLEHSMKAMFRPATIQGYVAKKLFLYEVSEVISQIPLLRRLFPIVNPRTERIPTLVAETAVKHYRQNSAVLWMNPMRHVRIKNTDELWKYNQFLGYAGFKMKTPTLVIAAKDDEAVPTEANAARLNQFLRKDSAISVIITKGGSHCAQSMIYGWQTTSSLYRSFILSNSPELLAKKEMKRAALKEAWRDLGSQNYPGEKIKAVEFGFMKGTPALELKLTTRLMAGQLGCQNANPGSCLRKMKFEIPFSEIKGASDWAYVPRNEAEAQSMTRWANANLKLINQNGKPVQADGVINKSFLSWISYGN